MAVLLSNPVDVPRFSQGFSLFGQASLLSLAHGVVRHFYKIFIMFWGMYSGSRFVHLAVHALAGTSQITLICNQIEIRGGIPDTAYTDIGHEDWRRVSCRLTSRCHALIYRPPGKLEMTERYLTYIEDSDTNKDQAARMEIVLLCISTIQTLI